MKNWRAFVLFHNGSWVSSVLVCDSMDTASEQVAGCVHAMRQLFGHTSVVTWFVERVV